MLEVRPTELHVRSVSRETHHISLSPSTIARVLGVIALLLVLASVAGQLSKFLLGHGHLKGLVPLFNLDQEQNIPTYFSALLMIFASLLLAVIAVLDGKHRTHDVSKWAILSFGFLYMAYDEAFQVHELLIRPVRSLLGGGSLGIFYYAWIIPGIALVLVIALYFSRFLWRLPVATRRTFLLAATLFIGGSIGFEMIGGAWAELHRQPNLTYSMITTVEESLEMAGVIVFIYGLLVYLADNYKEVRLRFAGVGEHLPMDSAEAKQGAAPRRHFDFAPGLPSVLTDSGSG